MSFDSLVDIVILTSPKLSPIHPVFAESIEEQYVIEIYLVESPQIHQRLYYYSSPNDYFVHYKLNLNH